MPIIPPSVSASQKGSESRMSIELNGITKRFGDFVALDNVDLTVRSGELLALLGPSGSGKTTLLRIIAGLDWPDQGSVSFDGEDALAQHPRQRRVGFVFQHYALFRHMTVFDNVAFGLTVKPRSERPSKAVIKEKVDRLLKLVQIDWLADRYPAQLSGGQRQRVALARALAIEPKVLLLDEPFGALDAQVRKELRRWLRRLHEEIHVTSVFVTHDQEEALEVADRVVVMGKGRIEQIGSPEDVYERPANPFVYEFLGNVNRLTVTMQGGRLSAGGVWLDGVAPPPAGAAHAYLRPHEIIAEPDAEGTALVRFVALTGPSVRLEVETGRDTPLVEVEMPKSVYVERGLKPGMRVSLRSTGGQVLSGA